MNIKRGLATLAIAALSLTSSPHAWRYRTGRGEAGQPVVLVLRRGRRMQTQAWRRAAKAFETGNWRQNQLRTKVVHQRRDRTAANFLNSDEAPDLVKGSNRQRLARRVSTVGLLTDLGDYVAAQLLAGTKKVTGAKRNSRQVRRELASWTAIPGTRYDQLR